MTLRLAALQLIAIAPARCYHTELHHLGPRRLLGPLRAAVVATEEDRSEAVPTAATGGFGSADGGARGFGEWQEEDEDEDEEIDSGMTPEQRRAWRRTVMTRWAKLVQEKGGDAGAEGGEVVAAFDRVSLRLGERLVLAPQSWAVRRGQRLGVLGESGCSYSDFLRRAALQREAMEQVLLLVGANGAGKSTLLRVAAGEWPLLAGEVARNCDDAAHRVSGGASAWEWICGEAAGLGEGAVRRALRQMGFPATAQRKPVSALSGGERTRLCIASMLLSRANLLVLDEPTNHLDLRAREYLGDALRSFDGAVLLVSHDRAFAAHVATRAVFVSLSMRRMHGMMHRTRTLTFASSQRKVAELRGGRLHAEQGDYRAYIERRDELRARIDRRAVSAGLPAEGGERGGTDGASSDRPSKRAARRRRSSR
ncbi:hypothetical protein EMIHUDRAFT_449434 [Emiliania huxleyi CCMP1516]|uniref:ABC transporter domain-containing protein n=2 Tax=Emiliania huxleyi TaxID=2903 RepID=A0A0D3KBP7_EMIH1|nr:hypothetical protein EMIHUDRAFT_449434 [Emiliania huxleyi CCMP1516]EOD33182.1 hypothetical protein EMIHUDRAFT_449434 [Emiliania huxleyi CCMP1516]|eukprot:XP_005785611.1 hypothetical protein EMIHUDRAFT_449434 [Emiliania huxleyi CCMP1516]